MSVMNKGLGELADGAATEKSSRRRSGGREARKAMRAAPLQQDMQPVRGGLEGGRYQPLSDLDVQKIHAAALDVLETIGMGDPLPSTIEHMTSVGCTVSDAGRVMIPRAVVEDTLAKAARNITLYGQDPKHDMQVSGQNTYYGTAGAAVHMVNVDTGEYRDSTVQDLYDIARIVDRMDNIHFFQASVVCRDLPDPRDMDVNTAYASVMGTSKHVGSRWFQLEHFEESMKIFHEIAGGEAAWRARPFVSMSNCFVVPPLKFAPDACLCLEAGVRHGMPILLLSAGQAGATSPAALAGSVVQATAEVLAGLVYVNAVQPGAPAIFGTWPFVSDLRTGAMSGGSGEQALLMAACGQMARFYDLPGGVAAGMTDAKLPDAQSGYEKSYTDALAGHSGANLVYESAGMHASLMGFCKESLIIDNDMLGAILRTIRGIEVNEENLSVDTMRQVCLEGPGHYLGHDQTLHLMQREYAYPVIGDRTSPKEWEERNRPNLVEEAKAKLADIEANYFPSHVSAETDARIRAEVPVNLPREKMIKIG
ncbi:trimethylamine methyltransferase family protein [Rhodovibrionaceae bacterium A322]